MTNETRQRLRDVMVSCEAIVSYTADLDFASDERDGMVRDAVERRLGIIGEAHLRATARESMLGRMIHGYGIPSG